MGKKELIVYTCDRCGKEMTDPLSGEQNAVARFRFLHIFKWFVPCPVSGYTLRYICNDCFKSFKEWYKGKQENEKKELLETVRQRINDAGNKGKIERYHVDGEHGEAGWMDYLKGIVDACWEIDGMIDELTVKDGEQE